MSNKPNIKKVLNPISIVAFLWALQGASVSQFQPKAFTLTLSRLLRMNDHIARKCKSLLDCSNHSLNGLDLVSHFAFGGTSVASFPIRQEVQCNKEFFLIVPFQIKLNQFLDVVDDIGMHHVLRQH